MAAEVTPLDPNSPEGIAAAERISQTFAEIQVAIWRRQAAASEEPASPKATSAPAGRPQLYRRPTDAGAVGHVDNGTAADEALIRIAVALERIADAIAGPAQPEADPLPEYPILDYDSDAEPGQIPCVPQIGRFRGRLYWAICPYCPAAKGESADPADPDTWLAHEESYDLDEQRVALTRHLAHHARLPVETDPLPIWTWADWPCPRCEAPPGQRCVTGTKRRPSTAIHARRWRVQADSFW